MTLHQYRMLTSFRLHRFLVWASVVGVGLILLTGCTSGPSRLEAASRLSSTLERHAEHAEDEGATETAEGMIEEADDVRREAYVGTLETISGYLGAIPGPWKAVAAIPTVLALLIMVGRKKKNGSVS